MFPYLIKDYNVSYAFSVSLWKLALKEPPAEKSFLAFAPVFSDEMKDQLTATTRSVFNGI